MSKPTHIAWVLGWAIPEPWFQEKVEKLLPDTKHHYIEPTPDYLTKLRLHAPYSRIIGYSLGSLLLLKDSKEVADLATHVSLLAPILGFTIESNLGGKISQAELKVTKRKLNQNFTQTMLYFYCKAGLKISESESSSLSLNTLNYGLDCLENITLRPESLPKWDYYLGSDDPLLDHNILQVILPNLYVVNGATHAPDLLLEALVKTL